MFAENSTETKKNQKIQQQKNTQNIQRKLWNGEGGIQENPNTTMKTMGGNMYVRKPRNKREQTKLIKKT